MISETVRVEALRLTQTACRDSRLMPNPCLLCPLLRYRGCIRAKVECSSAVPVGMGKAA